MIIPVVSVSILPYAKNSEGPKSQTKMSIEQRKGKLISSIDEHINMLQVVKACVSGVQVSEDSPKCRE